MPKSIYSCFFLTCLFLASCTTTPDPQSPEEALANADEIEDSNPEQSKQILEKFFYEAPFHKANRRLHLKLLQYSFELEDFDKVISLSETYLVNYEDSPEIDWVLLILAKSYFLVDKTALWNRLKTKLEQRDLGQSQKAIRILTRLIKDYPKSNYSFDAQQLRIFIINQLAAAEYEVMKLFVKKNNLLAAMDRGEFILDNYINAFIAPQVVEKLFQVYTKLQLKEKAQSLEASFGSMKPS